MAGIADKLIVITGAARGIGLATAQTLVRRGGLVAIGDLDAEAAQAAAAGLGDRARGFHVDVTDTDSFERLLRGSEEAFERPLDVLVNNAGIMWVGRFEEEREPVALAQMNVNFHGVVRGMKLAIPAMRSRGSGHVVNVASAASKFPPAGEATYAATKHAVYGYSVSVREELRGTGVEVSVVMPAVVETELAAGTGQGRSRRLVPTDVAESIADAIERPRFEVFIPRNLAVWARIVALSPQAARDALYKVMMPDQVRDTDQSAREGYERRAMGD